MDVLLTDDEVVALSAAAATAWPYGLLTVAADERAIVAAGVRGVRSLAVRGLVSAGTPNGVDYPPSLVNQVARIATARRHVMVQVCSREDLLQPRGAMVGAFAGSADGSWLVDSVTLSGVHAMRTTSPEEAAELILRFVNEVWENGVKSPDGGTRFGLFVTSSAVGEKSFFVSHGSTEAFVLTGIGGFELPAGRHAERWTLSDVRELMNS